MERETVLKMWDEMWTEGAWFGSWSGAMTGVTAAQAAWRPKPGAHSIWQLVNHVCFWREVTLKKFAGETAFTEDETESLNFKAPASPSEDQWASARRRLEATHQKMRAAIANEKNDLERPRYHLVHDANHLGQILYLRRLQDLAPVM